MSSRLRLRFVAAMLLANSSLYGQFFFPQSSKLTATGGIGAGSVGWSVALSSDGTTAIAGAPTDNGNVGAAYVYTRSGNT